jgi:tetratricopeptide (TPR) repeat protein
MYSTANKIPSSSVRPDNRQSPQILPLGHQNSLTDSHRMSHRDDLVVIAGRSNMGIALFTEGRLNQAEQILRYVYKERRRILGRNHHETMKSKANIAMTINEMGHCAQAESLYREALTFFHHTAGPTHSDTLKTYTNLATSLHDQAKYKEAEEVVAIAIPAMRATYGTSYAGWIKALEFRAILLHYLEEYAAALKIANQVYRRRLSMCGYGHGDTQRALAHVRDLAEDCEEQRSVEALNSCLAAIVV